MSIMAIIAEITDALMVLNKDQGMKLFTDIMNIITHHKNAATTQAVN